MQGGLTPFVFEFSSLALLLAIVAGTSAVGYVIRRALLSRLARWAGSTATQIDDAVVASIRGPFLIWFVIIGLYLALELSEYPERFVNVIQKTLVVLAILSVTIAAATMASRII
ncbi:MAG: hypothetical protein WAW06_07660, partial [bacterium]